MNTHPWYRAEVVKALPQTRSRMVYVRKVSGYEFEPEKTVEVFDGGYPFRVTPEVAKKHLVLGVKLDEKGQADTTRRRDWEMSR